MKAIEPYAYMACVRDLFYLKFLPANKRIQGRPELGEQGVLEHIDDLLRHLEQSDMEGTLGSQDCGHLISIGDTLWSRVFGNRHARIRKAERDVIRQRASEMESSLFNESRLVTVYDLGESYVGFDSETLLPRISGRFDAHVFGLLPMVASENFKEAEQALAFHLPVAAAMLSFRGCEALFRAYYFLSDVPGDPLRAFGPLLNHLDKKWEHKETFSETLDYIKTIARMRNRAVHPERYYDVKRADTLLRVCAEACDLMITNLVDDIDKFQGFGDCATRTRLRASSDEVRRSVVGYRMHSDEINDALFRWIRMEPQVEGDDELTP